MRITKLELEKKLGELGEERNKLQEALDLSIVRYNHIYNLNLECNKKNVLLKLNIEEYQQEFQKYKDLAQDNYELAEKAKQSARDEFNNYSKENKLRLSVEEDLRICKDLLTQKNQVIDNLAQDNKLFIKIIAVITAKIKD